MSEEKPMTPEEMCSRLEATGPCGGMSMKDKSQILRLWRSQLWTEAAEAISNNIPSEKLRLLADWIDAKYPNDINDDVQYDLRKWASSLDPSQIVAELEKKNEWT